MMALKQRYQKSFEFWSSVNDGGWQDWFNTDIPSELAFPSETEFTGNIISEMLDQGETHWSHPGWNRDLWALLEEWAIDGQLIRVRLTASWLLRTLPDDPIDGEMRDRLSLLSEGDFCRVFEGESSALYANREYYLKSMQWGMLPYVADWFAEIGV
jgi:hypothetical protein